MSRKRLSGLLDARRKGRPIEPKNLYDGHCHAVSRGGNNASAADHLWMAGGDRRLKHSVLGELAGRSCGRCPRIPRLHAEAVIRWYQSEAVTCLIPSREPSFDRPNCVVLRRVQEIEKSARSRYRSHIKDQTGSRPVHKQPPVTIGHPAFCGANPATSANHPRSRSPDDR